MAISQISAKIKEDQLFLMENELRTKGAWHDITGLDKMSHYFVASNKSVSTAISLCFTVVTTFDKLRAPLAGKKCLVCDLFQQSRKEVHEKHIQTIDNLQSELSSQE